MREKIMNVPYTSQLNSTVMKGTESCGITSLYMVMNYLKSSKTPSISDVTLYALKIGAFNHQPGWIHAGLVKTAQYFGLTALRRSYFPHPDFIKKLKAEGVKKEGLVLLVSQLFNEGVFEIVSSLESGYPVIASVSERIRGTGSGHLIVLTGVKKSASGLIGFYSHNPYNSRGLIRSNEFIPLKKFEKIWQRAVIFVRKK